MRAGKNIFSICQSWYFSYHTGADEWVCSTLIVCMVWGVWKYFLPIITRGSCVYYMMVSGLVWNSYDCSNIFLYWYIVQSSPANISWVCLNGCLTKSGGDEDDDNNNIHCSIIQLTIIYLNSDIQQVTVSSGVNYQAHTFTLWRMEILYMSCPLSFWCWCLRYVVLCLHATSQLTGILLCSLHMYG